MRIRDVARVATSPRLLRHHLRAKIYEIRHPDHPWWSPSAIELLNSLLRPEMAGLEWGSGRSTAWLAQRIATLTTVEHDPIWFGRVRKQLAALGATNVDLQLHELPSDPAAFGASFWEEHPYAMVVNDFPDSSLDIVAVDGAYRMSCAWRALPKIRPGGLLLVDDALHLGSLEAWRIPDEWRLLHGPGPGVWSTTIWQRPLA